MDTTHSEPAPVPPSVLRSVLDAALAAPSGDNCQPWRIVLRPSGFDVRFVAQRAAALLDVNGLASRISLGALLENASICARGNGCGLRWELDPDPDDPLLHACVSVGGSVRDTDELAPVLLERQTNRHRFSTQPLTTNEAHQLEREAVSPADIVLLTDRPRIDRFARLAAIADRARAENQQAHEDLHRWVRWTADEAERTRDGLDVRTLGLAPFERAILAALRPWSLARVANILGGSRATGAYGRKLALRSGAIGLISVPNLTPAHAVAAGRAMERAWLRATRLGLGFSPLATLPLLGLRAEESGSLSPRHSQQVGRANAELHLLAATPPGRRILFAFRVGHHPLAAVRALRLPLEDVLAEHGNAPTSTAGSPAEEQRKASDA